MRSNPEVVETVFLWSFLRGFIGFAFTVYLMVTAYQFLDGQKAITIKDGSAYIENR